MFSKFKMESCKECSIIFNHKKSHFIPSMVGLPMEYFKAVISHEYDRKIMPKFEQHIENLWQKRLEDNPNIYNGSKFRFQGLTEGREFIQLRFGLTSYKEFQCTNMQPKASLEILKDYGWSKYGDVFACMANPTFSTVIVESSDNYAVMFKRSNLVGESPGMVDFPGGHMEPNEVDKAELIENMTSEKVVNEFFYSALREVRDEINLPESLLSWPTLLGVLRNNEIGGKPGACFYIRCACSSKEIKQMYQEGGPESFESTELILIKMEELYDETSLKVAELKKKMAVSASAAHVLFKPYYQERS